jgi:DNA (cytosine-5)-methyltransferase 1
MRLFELFAGIGANSKALKNLGIPHELIGYSEIDKYASKAFSVIHGVSEELNFGDITKIDTDKLPDFDLMTFGFPCQSFSVAGKQLGFSDARGTLFFEAYRILSAKLPKYFIFENVKGLLSHGDGKTLEVIMEHLGALPYEITMDLLNAKDYGIPQNRERLFCFGRRIDDVG